MDKKNIWIVGAGFMAKEHSKALIALNQKPIVIGNSEEGANEFEQQLGIPVVTGGIYSFLDSKPQRPDIAIIALPIDKMAEATLVLAKYGIPILLVEKPFGANPKEIRNISHQIKKTNSQIYIAYNRRYFDSVQKAKEIIHEDGGLSSIHFEFTEWSHSIPLKKFPPDVLTHWFLANSSHVTDTVFYLMGKVKSIHTMHSGSLEWHPSGSIFCGSGLSDQNVPFTYNSNWESAGRWSIELSTSKRKLILRPMEILQQTLRGKVNIEKIEIKGQDSNFKPGLFRMHSLLLQQYTENFCTLNDLVEHLPIYEKIANYNFENSLSDMEK
jgi:predicted dehydrogenase